MRLTAYILLILIFAELPTHAQRKIVNQTASFSTADQNMWGPGNSPGINTTLEIFPEYKTKLPFDTRDFTILEFEGLAFGAGIDGYFEFGIGPFQFVIEGFDLGTIDVDYPTTVSIDVPDNGTFNAGETIEISSSFSADPGAQIISHYPSAENGRVALEMGMLFDADLGFSACLVDCLPRVSLINPPSRPLLDQDFKFFEVKQDQITYICPEFDPLNPEEAFQCVLSTGGPPWSFTDPYDIFTAEAQLPFVVTSSQIVGGTDLEATGEDTYVNNSLNVIKLIGLIPVVKPFAEVIEGSKDLITVKDFAGNDVSVTVTWALVRITLNIPITQKQRFRFKPEVVTTLNFPDTVEYVVHSKKKGDIYGKGPSLQYQVGDKVSVDFPCEYDYMDVYATHSIKNAFSNKTNDNIGLNLKVEALEFGLHIDPFIIIPEVCIPIPFSSDFCVGPVGSPEVDETFGPLWDPEPIVLLDQDFPPYVDKTWELKGFEDFKVVDPFRLEPRKAIIDFVTSPVDCHGDSTGTITTNFSNATEPVTYEWSFGSTDKSPKNVPGGTHEVKITDARGCVRFESVTIDQPPKLVASITKTPIACHGASQSAIDVTVQGGAGSYTYLWNTGETAPNLSDKPAGNYSVTITDARGCTIQRYVSVTEPETLEVSIFNLQEPRCFGANDGSLDLYVAGGTPPYSFLWSNGQIGQSIEELVSGTYSVTAKDANGCTMSDNITIGQPTKLEAGISKGSDVSCLSAADGSLSVQAAGGTPPYTYTWYNADVRLGQKTTAITGLVAGSYSVEVLDSKGCRAVTHEVIDQPSIPLQATATPTHLTCLGDEDGAIDLRVMGGTPPYQFDWSNGAITEDIAHLTEGAYEVLITDSQNCTFGTKTLVIGPTEIKPTFSISTVSCQQQKDGSIAIIALSGGAEPYQIAWSTGSTDMRIDELAAGSYSVAITDGNGCVLEKAFTINKSESTCLFIPSAFSPNGDGINDTWKIRNIALYPNVELRVFNKWGIDVFTDKGYKTPWDGSYKGKLLEPATYYYRIDLKDGSPLYEGTLNILK